MYRLHRNEGNVERESIRCVAVLRVHIHKNGAEEMFVDASSVWRW